MLTIKQKSTFLFDCLPSFQEGYLDVGDGHKIYYEQYGNPNGKPILFLHGGPGAGFSSSHKGFFDPKLFRVIFFDQRGSGKSIPYAETESNNTEAILSDIELLRSLLKIDQWYLFGGSWGSTLALLYGIKFPKRKTFFGEKVEKLRYGENPHQNSSLYLSDSNQDNLSLKKINGKDLSYNNYNDIFSALEILYSEKKMPTTVIVKHANPCGVASNKSAFLSFL